MFINQSLNLPVMMRKFLLLLHLMRHSATVNGNQIYSRNNFSQGKLRFINCIYYIGAIGNSQFSSPDVCIAENFRFLRSCVDARLTPVQAIKLLVVPKVIIFFLYSV